MTTVRRPRTRLPAQERREQLLIAATALIGERGYWALSLQDVADACELSLAGLLHHFPSKDALLLAVLDRRDQLEAHAVSRSLGVEQPEGVDPESRLVDWSHVSVRALCDALVLRNSASAELVRLYAVLEAESLGPEHPASAYFARRQHSTIALFCRLLDDRPGAELVARQLLALMDGIQLQWLREPQIDLLELWRSIAADALDRADAVMSAA